MNNNRNIPAPRQAFHYSSSTYYSPSDSTNNTYINTFDNVSTRNHNTNNNVDDSTRRAIAFAAVEAARRRTNIMARPSPRVLTAERGTTQAPPKLTYNNPYDSFLSSSMSTLPTGMMMTRPTTTMLETNHTNASEAALLSAQARELLESTRGVFGNNNGAPLLESSTNTIPSMLQTMPSAASVASSSFAAALAAVTTATAAMPQDYNLASSLSPRKIAATTTTTTMIPQKISDRIKNTNKRQREATGGGRIRQSSSSSLRRRKNVVRVRFIDRDPPITRIVHPNKEHSPLSESECKLLWFDEEESKSMSKERQVTIMVARRIQQRNHNDDKNIKKNSKSSKSKSSKSTSTTLPKNMTLRGIEDMMSPELFEQETKRKEEYRRKIINECKRQRLLSNSNNNNNDIKTMLTTTLETTKQNEKLIKSIYLNQEQEQVDNNGADFDDINSSSLASISMKLTQNDRAYAYEMAVQDARVIHGMCNNNNNKANNDSVAAAKASSTTTMTATKGYDDGTDARRQQRQIEHDVSSSEVQTLVDPPKTYVKAISNQKQQQEEQLHLLASVAAKAMDQLQQQQQEKMPTKKRKYL